jgi:hypothetical protein
MSKVCDCWLGDKVCGQADARHYLTGYRCPAHTPAATRGAPEPGATASHRIKPLVPAPMSASRVNDDRAIASGKRRSSPARFREAQQRVSEATR